jgi:hypothetical protein
MGARKDVTKHLLTDPDDVTKRLLTDLDDF